MFTEKEPEFSSSQINPSTKGRLETTTLRERVSTPGQTRESSMAPGRKTKCTAEAPLNGIKIAFVLNKPGLTEEVMSESM